MPSPGETLPVSGKVSREMKQRLDTKVLETGMSQARLFEFALERFLAPPDPVLPPEIRDVALELAAVFAGRQEQGVVYQLLVRGGPDAEEIKRRWFAMAREMERFRLNRADIFAEPKEPTEAAQEPAADAAHPNRKTSPSPRPSRRGDADAA
jgi:hypothetical protein